MIEGKANFSEKYKIVETRYCEWTRDENGKCTVEEDCTHCKHCILGERQMCSDGNERRFSKCMVKGEPYTIHLDSGRCDFFEK
jgi:hypothetical protein